jgi:hypothetical protein
MTNEPTATAIEQERDAMVRLVVDQLTLEGQALSHAAVAKRLPADFAYCMADSFERFVVATNQDPPRDPESAAGAGLSGPAANTLDSLHAQAHEIECELFEVRNQLTVATAARQSARAIMARHLLSYENGGLAPISDSQLRRDVLAASLIEREQAKTDGRSRIPSGGNSKWAVDSQRARWGSTPEDYARKNFQNGNRVGFADAAGHRGRAYPLSMKGTKVGDR